MSKLRPKFISFDCSGTLSRPTFADQARTIYADRLAAAEMDEFIRTFSALRLDEVLGDWQPYRDVVLNAIVRTCRKAGVRFDAAEAEPLYDNVPHWRPHPDVPAGLKAVAFRSSASPTR